MESKVHGDSEFNEHNSVRKLFCVVLCHYIHSVKGGWQHLEETVNFLLMQREQVSSSLFLITLRADSKKVPVTEVILKLVHTSKDFIIKSNFDLHQNWLIVTNAQFLSGPPLK